MINATQELQASIVMLKMVVWEVFGLVFLLSTHFLEAQNVVTVSPECSQTDEDTNRTMSSGLGELFCFDLDSALNELRNGTSLILEPGTHIVRQAQRLYVQPSVKMSLSDISITGAGVNETVVTCEVGYGLVFIGVRNLNLMSFTITNCGLANAHLNHSLSILHSSIDYFFHSIPPSANTTIAMLVGNCQNVRMEGIHITNTTGLGLLGINVVGLSKFRRVEFTRNIRPQCLNEVRPDTESPSYFSQIGGGAHFLYFDYIDESSGTHSAKLMVDSSYFAHNADCTSSAVTSVNFGFDVSSLLRYNYTLGAGGGLSVITASRNISVAASIQNSIFYQNDAKYGAGAYVATFADIPEKTFVEFRNCTFLENGVAAADGIRKTFCRGGGGLAIFTGLAKLQDFVREANTEIETSVLITVAESTFTRNVAAIQGGGAMAYSLFFSRPGFAVLWKFSNTTFQQNSARFSSALHAQESASSHVSIITLQNINVVNNYHNLNEDRQQVDEDDAAVHITDVARCAVNGAINFLNNVGSALRIKNTPCAVSKFSTMTFQQNLAIRGGAIYLSGQSAFVELSTGSRLNFIGNQAVTEGGALYVAPLSVHLEVLQPESADVSECFITSVNSNFSLLFLDNRAPLGSIFFGPSQKNCAWAADYMHEKNLLNTLPASIAVNLSRTLGEPASSVVPGQSVDIEIEVIDEYNQTIPALVSSVVDISNSQATSTLGSSGFWYTAANGSQLTITAANYSGPLRVSIIAEQNSINAMFTLQLDPCPLGFASDKFSPRCTCHDTLLNASEITCVAESVSFVTSENTWLGFDPNIPGPPTTFDLIIHRCVFNYCKALGNNNTVFPPDFDSQCNFNRSGLICGHCKEGYSHVFGTNECHKCSNLWLILIPSFTIAGAALFSGIALFEITIDKGLTNVVIFFGSLVSQFDFLAPSSLHYSDYFLPFRLLALQLGVSTCFYDGMTTLQRSALLFVFPVYLYVLMGIFTLLCRRFTWMSVHFSPAKTLATLTVMCYLSVLNTAVGILMFVRVESIGGEVSYRWRFDPTLVYFDGAHAALAVVAILVVILYIIPTPLLFLFPFIAYKYLKKYIPFWDILWAAYKPKFRFWLGIRVILIISLFPTTQIRLSLVNSSMSLLFLVIEACIHPFEDKWANYADIALLTCFTLYVRRIQLLAVEQQMNGTNIDTFSNITIAVSTLIMFVIYFLLFAQHIYRQFPSLRSKMCRSAVRRCFKPPVKASLNGDINVSSVPSETALELSEYEPPALTLSASNARFRDSILEDLDR